MAEAMPGGMKNVKDVVALSSAYLAAKGIDTARLDAEKLIGSVLGLDRLALYLHHDRPVTPAELDAIRPLLRRRADLEPVDRIGVAIEFLESDLAAAVVGRTFDVIAANLPYIPEGDPRTEAGVVRHEPHLALYAGPDGLELIRRLVADAPVLLNPGGMIVLENSDEQATAVRELLEAAGFGEVAFHRDLAGVDRVVAGRLV